jgi:glycerol 2-dehydrogenase (NADP+)
MVKADIPFPNYSWSSDHRRIASALQKSLHDLKLDYVDLYLMHWPVTLPTASPETYGKEDRTAHDLDWDFTDTWREMEKLVETGKVRAIGVANFSTVNLQKLLKSCKIVPAVNQTEIQPLLPQKNLNALCTERGVHQTAFGPLGGSGSTLHENYIVNEIAKRRECSTGNVLLSWGVKKGWSVIPKSVNPARIQGNLQKCFAMNDQEVAQIDGLVETLGGKRFNRPNWGAVIFHDDEAENVK